MGLTNLLNLSGFDYSGLKIVNTCNYPLVPYVCNYPCLTGGISGGVVYLGGYSGHYRSIWDSRVNSVACFSSQNNNINMGGEDRHEGIWDRDKGVWIGERAIGFDEIPRPLYIFGYGSLCWRPEASWSHWEPGFVATVEGYKRLFAQKSMDHRGTPKNPGLVATLISDEDLKDMGMRIQSDPPSKTVGKIYRVPDKEVESVLRDLDFREKGGYSRHIVTAVPRESGQSIEVLVYTGRVHNPNFALRPVEKQAEVIAKAIGPSGRNSEYLFQLADFVRFANGNDESLFHLEASVRRIIEISKN